MKLSAYVITRNEERFLPACLGFLCRLTDDVVVVDAESDDRTPEIARSFPRVRFLSRPMPFRFADQRNIAQLFCRGDWILTLDGDELFPEAFVRLLPALLNDERYHAYSFPRLVLADPERYLVKDDLDAQFRLFRRQNTWGHEGSGGLHECLLHEGVPLSAHPAHAPAGVRYVHCPVLHYQLLKSDPELRSKAPAFLQRQAPSHPIQVTDGEWWVRAKHAMGATLPLSGWRTWLAYPPQESSERLRYLQEEVSRIDELVEYTGLTHERVRQIMGASGGGSGEEGIRPVPSGDFPPWKPGYDHSEPTVSESFDKWKERLCALTQRYLCAADFRDDHEELLAAMSGARHALVCGASLGDLVFEASWRDLAAQVTYADIDSPAQRFFEWRLGRFGKERIHSMALGDAAARAGEYDVIILAADVAPRWRDSPRVMGELTARSLNIVYSRWAHPAG
jgi:hypothetical protein